MKKYLLISTLILTTFFCLQAQEKGTSKATNADQSIDLYLDCIACDIEYIKENLTVVNYSREPNTADLHVMVTSLQTGSGGKEFMMEFVGQQHFKNKNDTLKFSTSSELSADELRTELLSMLEVGLVPYLLKTSYADKITVLFEEAENTKTEKSFDPWKNWIYNIDLYGSASGQKQSSSYMLNANLYAGKVTPDFKIEAFTSLSFMENKYCYTVPDQSLTSIFSSSEGSEGLIADSTITIFDIYRDLSCYGLFVQSMGPHFGLGAFASMRSSVRSNLDFQLRLMPAIEYSLFEYENSSRKQLCFLYSFGYEFNNYTEQTIYNKASEGNFRQDLNIGYKVMDKNGSINATVFASSYIPDISKFNVGIRCRASRRVFGGLSVNANFSVEMPRNQITISGSGYDEFDIITGQREMQTTFRYAVGIGINFSFGSKHNNAVNPRFSF